MKKLLMVLALLAMVTSVEAAPFLTCDDPNPQEQVTHYMVGENKVDTLTPGKALWYDLASVPNGDFKMDVKACNMWGCSAVSSFLGNRVLPSIPGGMSIVTGE